MEQERLVDELEHNPARGKCVNCDNPEYEEGYPTHLCRHCRQLYIKYPIPLWIKIFSGGIFLVILFSLFSFPENLRVAIHQQRGKDAERENKFLTVQKEFEQVLKRSPENKEAKAYLMLAAYYNEDFETFFKYSEELDGQNFGNEDLLERLNDIVDQVPHYYPNNEIFSLYTDATKLFEAEKYRECDSILDKLLVKDLVYQPALRLMAGSKRQEGDYEGSIEYCKRILEINHESNYAYANMARTLLKQKKDKEALEMAQKSMSLNDTLPYNIATLILAYHFNNDIPKRDALIHKIDWDKDSTATEYFQYAIDIIENKEPFRN